MAESLEAKYSQQLQDLREELQAIIPSNKDGSGASDIEAIVNGASDDLDGKLAKFIVLKEATPKGLAKFAAESEENQNLVDNDLLTDQDIMKKMVWNDGPVKSHYPQALKIYRDIEKIKKDGAEPGGILDRLALAVALEHAEPVTQRNPVDADPDANKYVDPVKRYEHYANAYEAGELDPDFSILTTWDLRFVVDESEPDDTKTWGRRTLRNFQPKHVLTTDSVWRYVGIVRSDIRYGSQDVKHDQPDLQFFQNILMNGGICGRRAFSGRFFLRAFGIPTAARPSKGHGALCHWTKDHGWVVNLGPGWGSGRTKTRYVQDVDFRDTAKARQVPEEYWKMKRAQWAGDVHGEPQVFGAKDDKIKKIGFWYKQALDIQKGILDSNSATCAASSPSDTCRPRTLAEEVEKTPTSKEELQVKVHDDGSITIPAVAYENPNKVKDVQQAKCFQGGKQVYLPAVQAQGLTIMRGGCWKSTPEACTSGNRLKSGGLGKYSDWGFRVVLTAGDDKSCPKKEISLDLGEGVELEMVYVAPGNFTMGGDSTEDGRFKCIEVPHHEVEITKGFYIGKYPVTQAQYQAIIGNNPSKSTKDPNCPVDNIGESDARDFVQAYIDTFGKDLRLPSEAEWEYSSRAGASTKYFFGDDASQLGEYAWFKGNSGMKSHPVGELKPNPFGLYDVYGNVLERINDKYEKSFYEKGPKIDPTGPSAGTKSHFEFKINISQGGKYELTAHVVTNNHHQSLKVAVGSDDEEGCKLELPFTLGDWQDSKPVVLDLPTGENTLRFWRDAPPQYGIAMKNFTLTPLVTPT